MDSAYLFFISFFFGWIVILLALRKYVSRSTDSSRNAVEVSADFAKFQRLYLLVFLLMNGADWLQGPYVYALYSSYGFSISDIGLLFIVGFLTSAIVGTFAGPAADKYGRKFVCLTYAVLYIASCITKNFNDFRILMIGRFLGGISTSILFSAFESWMVHQHHEQKFDEKLIGLTFSASTLGNGLVAIVAGVIASFCVDHWGPVAPFNASILFLSTGFVIVLLFWKENYGDSSINISSTFSRGTLVLWNDRRVLLLGMIQSFFEGAMYIFVFMWTPSLENSAKFNVLHGWVFSTFMICTLCGSYIFRWLYTRFEVERFTSHMLILASVSLFIPSITSSLLFRLLSFFMFELCCGIYWPAFGTMRSKYVPEEVRATVMNFFRVPLNFLVVFVLTEVGKMTEATVFSLCSLFLCIAAILQNHLCDITIDTQSTTDGEDQMLLHETSTKITLEED